MKLRLTHSQPRADDDPRQLLPVSLQAHKGAELVLVAAKAWDRWLESARREIALRRENRELRAQVRRLQRRLAFQRALAHLKPLEVSGRRQK